jgi:hypothetical protein
MFAGVVSSRGNLMIALKCAAAFSNSARVAGWEWGGGVLSADFLA